MPALAVLLTLLFVFLLIVLPIWTFFRAKTAQEHARRLQTEVQDLQRQVARLGGVVVVLLVIVARLQPQPERHG